MELHQKILLLRKMIRTRHFEEVVALKKESNTIHGPVHTTIGQEAVDIGVCSALSPSDYIIGTHRSHGYMLGKGVDPKLMMAEIYGKSTGTNGGKGGSMHVSDWSVRSLGATGIVGSGLPIACGAAFASKFRNTTDIACAFFGDGASNEGTFHESLNLASIWKLPVLFVLKNNGLAITVPINKSSPTEHLHTRAKAYNIANYTVDGQDVEAVFDLVKKIVIDIRSGSGPVLLEANTIRFREHQEGLGYKRIADSNYRDVAKTNNDILTKDPLQLYAKALIGSGVLSQVELTNIYAEEMAIINEAVKFAEDSPPPSAAEAYKDIYAREVCI